MLTMTFHKTFVKQLVIETAKNIVICNYRVFLLYNPIYTNSLCA